MRVKVSTVKCSDHSHLGRLLQKANRIASIGDSLDFQLASNFFQVMLKLRASSLIPPNGFIYLPIR